MEKQDSVYDRTKPWQTNEERLTGEALSAAAGMPVEQVRSIRPPIPRISMIPPRFGYLKRAVGIDDVAQLDATYPGARITYADASSGGRGTSMPALGTV